MSKKKIIPELPTHWRDRMLTRLREQGHSDEVLKAYATERAILLPNEDVAEWPMHKVPENKDGMEALSKDVEVFVLARKPRQGDLKQSASPAASNEADAAVEKKTDEAVDLQRSRRVRKPAPTTLEKLPVHSVEAELGVLSCQLIDPLRCIPETLEKFKGDPERHYDVRHSLIQKALFEMFSEQKGIDLITLYQWLKDKKLLEQAGGLVYLSPLPGIAPSAGNLSYYLEHVHEKFLVRSLVNTCTDTIVRINDHEGEIESLFDEVERDIFKITGLLRDDKGSCDALTLVKKTINTIEKHFANKGALTGLSTGLIDVDKMTTGMHPGEFWIVAGLQSVGKTSLAMNIAEHVALNLNLPVGIFSYEMSAEALMLRFVCSRGRVNLRNVRGGDLTQGDFEKLTEATNKLAYAKLHIEEMSDQNILELRARGRRMAQEHGVKLFVVDYLQKVPGSTARKSDNKEQEVSSVSSGLKAMAMELQIPVLAISAVNDEGRMRDSRMIGYDGDFVGLLEPETTETELTAVKAFLRIKKQRNGPTGSVALTFLKEFTRFENAAKISDEEELQ